MKAVLTIFLKMYPFLLIQIGKNRKTIEIQRGKFSSWWENKKRKDQFEMNENEKHKKVLVNIKDYAVQYEGTDKEAFSGLNFTVEKGERVALHGAFYGKGIVMKHYKWIIPAAGILLVMVVVFTLGFTGVFKRSSGPGLISVTEATTTEDEATTKEPDTEPMSEETASTEAATENIMQTEAETEEEINMNNNTGTPFSIHGKLALNGTDIVDSHGEKFQLKGISTHGISIYPQYISKEAFQTFRDEWGANLIRLANYTAEYNGYCTGGDQTYIDGIIDTGVKACTELGMYVIIDWHILSDGNPNVNRETAKAFFTKMADKYKNYDNVIYEICNEPNGGVAWGEVKNYADEIISIIRNFDEDALIVVGTPTWSQDVDLVAANPVNQQYNVMYTLHFYAATHKEELMNKLKTAVAAGTPIFITEFSICDASGNGGLDYDSAEKWKNLMNSLNISYAGWNLSNKDESSAIIKKDCVKTSNWSDEDISGSGLWLKNLISGN